MLEFNWFQCFNVSVLMPLHCNFNIRIEVGHCNLEGSSRSHMFFKIGVLKNFPNFTGKQLCWSLFLTKFFTNFIKNTPTQVFSCEICKTFKNTFFDRTPPVAASVKRDSNAGVYLWNLLNFWLYFFGRTTQVAASEWTLSSRKIA